VRFILRLVGVKGVLFRIAACSKYHERVIASAFLFGNVCKTHRSLLHRRDFGTTLERHVRGTMWFRVFPTLAGRVLRHHYHPTSSTTALQWPPELVFVSSVTSCNLFHLPTFFHQPLCVFTSLSFSRYSMFNTCTINSQGVRDGNARYIRIV
jgi:hypothetical protein